MADFRDKHPGAITPSTKAWTGTEVEGRWAGRPMCVIAEPLDEEELNSVRAWANSIQQGNAITVILYTESFPDDIREWQRHISFFQVNALVTQVASRMLDQMPWFMKNVRKRFFVPVMIRILDVEWGPDLREGDQVSLGVPYNIVTFRSPVSSHPEDYLGDQPL